jgi:phage terminase large subunit
MNCKTYYDIKSSRKRFIVNQGGSRSGKTYSTIQVIIEACMIENASKMVIDIIRKFSSSHDGACLSDFKEILEVNRLWDDKMFNKKLKIYILNGNRINFVGLDQPQKVRGRKRDLAYLNEGNELTEEDFLQVNMRTTGRIIVDFNPSFVKNKWIDALISNKDKCDFFITTYKDNPFLGQAQRQELEDLQYSDPIKYQVYTKGERAVPIGQVFRDWLNMNSWDWGSEEEYFYGMDFGYNDPTALVRCCVKDNGVGKKKLIVEEIIYKEKMELGDYRDVFFELQIDNSVLITADSARTDIISYLSTDYQRNHRTVSGYNIIGASKNAGSIIAGITQLKSYDLCIVNSPNLCYELEHYMYKESNNSLEENPKDKNNHGIDALRYAIQHLMSDEVTDLDKNKFGFILDNLNERKNSIYEGFNKDRLYLPYNDSLI